MRRTVASLVVAVGCIAPLPGTAHASASPGGYETVTCQASGTMSPYYGRVYLGLRMSPCASTIPGISGGSFGIGVPDCFGGEEWGAQGFGWYQWDGGHNDEDGGPVVLTPGAISGAGIAYWDYGGYGAALYSFSLAEEDPVP